MDRERGNSLPLPSTVTKFHRRNAISGPSSTFKLLRSNTSSVSSQAVEEDEADLRLINEEGGNRGREVRDEDPDEKSESERDILRQGRRKWILKGLIWVIMALAFPIMIGYYLLLPHLLLREFAGIAPSLPGSASNQENCQASSGEALRDQIVSHQSADSMDFLFCRQGVNADQQRTDTPRGPVPDEGNASFQCPSYGIRDTRAPSS